MTNRANTENPTSRLWRALAAFAFAFAAGSVFAQPATGTIIPNRATGTAQIGATPITAQSNTVLLVTSSPLLPNTFAALLTSNSTRSVAPGSLVSFPHTLTNIGATSDTYTVTATDSGGTFTLGGLAIYLDANGDGVADNATPLTGNVTLNQGESVRFVVSGTVPAGAPIASSGMVIVSVRSSGNVVVAPNIDQVTVYGTPGVADCALVTKMLSRERGLSPFAPVTVTLRYSSCDKARERVVMEDLLPSGMRYLPGTGRWSGLSGTALSDASGDRQGAGATQIAYDFTSGKVNATVFGIAAGTAGTVTFDVEIAPSLPIGTVVTNTAAYVFSDASGNPGNRQTTESPTYTVTGLVDLELKGETIASAAPGTTVTFNNLLTNRGSGTDRFDITLAGSNFPQGTTFALFQPDGVTPLADTDGNGTPDTGPVAANGTYRIVLRASIPATAPPGAYKVTKTARSALSPARSASDDDVVASLGKLCKTVLDPDNQSMIGRGQRVTYTHYVTNRGNCDENLTVALGYITNDQPGWTATVWVDNPVAGGQSIVGALDPTDTPIITGWTAMLVPGAKLRILVEVVAPPMDAKSAALRSANTKDTVATNATTLTLTANTSGALMVRDITVVDDKDGPPEPQNAIRNYTDGSYGVPTTSAVIGRAFYLRANAAACNTQPTVVDTRTVVITGPRGERQTAIATETGPNTGIFTVPALPVRDATVVADNGTLEGRVNDVFEVDLQGCGRTIATAVTLIESMSIVFDSATNLPVAGAKVMLVTATPTTCSKTEVASGITGPNGRFSFTASTAGWYCLEVAPPNGYSFASKVPWTQLVPGRNLNVNGLTSGGSYGTPFQVNDGMVVVDVPVDATAQDGLFVRKNASRLVAEMGEFIDYVVRVRNNTGNVLDRASVVLVDSLPAGFAYVKGTARRNGAALPDPVGGAGPRLVLDLGNMTRGQEIDIAYRVRLGPGAMQGDGVNRVQASYTAGGITTNSNIASVKVTVVGGVFSDRGFILGKVYLDCNANGVQDKGELGVAGVRLFLEDGTFILTDGEGKYSFYGIQNRTHVLKADKMTLPPGTSIAAIGARSLGDGGSRIVDLKAGELHRGDFALRGCEPAVIDEVKARAKALAESGDSLAALAGAQLATEARVLPDLKAQSAAGIVSTPTAPGGTAAPGLTDSAGASQQQSLPFNSVVEMPVPQRPTPAPQIDKPAAAQKPAAPLVDLEKLLPELDNTLAFVGLKDGDVLPRSQTVVRVKGAAGTTFVLSVNGTDVADNRVGKRAVLAEKNVQAWEYFGIDLKPGVNMLTLTMKDQFGNARGNATISIRAPGNLGKIVVVPPVGGGIADGRSAAKVLVKLFDDNDVPVTVRTAVTLEANRGQWTGADADINEPGFQVFVEGGQGEFALSAPLEPGPTLIFVSSGTLKVESRVDFLPELRNLIAAGVIEGVVNLRNINTRTLTPTRDADGFEQELRHLSKEFDDGKGQAGARAAFFLKGKIKGDILLTAAYDSDKDTKERLFRDIQPDEFYPVYGDSGVRGYDAQSTSKLYVRLDKGRSYLLWGDFTTQTVSEVRKLSNYNRSLTGIRQHYENDRVSVNAFASKDSTRQVIEELRANGTSGPYELSTRGALVNSEKVEIITRDRNQPSLIIETLPQSRFTDYEIDSLTGRILFRSPVSSVDKNLNPVFIRVTYEVDQGGEKFWVGGVEAQVKVTENIEVGASYAEDRNPEQPFKLAGANATVKLGENAYVIGELAQSQRGVDNVKGDAARIELKYDNKGLKANAFVARTDKGFDNPGSYLTQGRSESGGRVEWQARPGTQVRAEVLRSEDLTSNSVRDGALAAVTQEITDRMSVEVGVRHAREKGSISPYPVIDGQPTPVPMPDEVTTVRARLTGQVPFVEGVSVYGEAEVDVKDADRKILALGGEYMLPNRGRIYARHEFVSSITGPYGLNPSERQNTTAVGVDTEYMKDGRVFSEYRIRDAMSGGDAEAAIGLKNLWTLATGLRLGTSIERVHALSGTGQNENTALALALEYTANPLWKGTTRLELREATGADSLLFTVGLAAKLNANWTVLGRNAYSLQRNKATADAPATEREIERLQAGLAWRDTETNKWNALARVEHRMEGDSTRAGIALKTTTDIVSLHADWQPVRPFLVTGRLAAKWTNEKTAGITAKYRAQLIGGRATWEFAPKWDVALVTSVLFGETTASRQYGVGMELGYNVATNLWVSAGYNFFGYRDDALAGADYSAKGPYVRLRYKFDESSLEVLQ
ncbi:SdrD B-like domain-containing protein [Usitatibacter palustris]|uniref:SdrD B-like domain-containing protein n=1 Tax=Usitatibacter palustris TaxID=2732487 RepID=UPI0014886DF6|nr:SdrD B-like domain-containing protein [Usitatibacter palustris]